MTKFEKDCRVIAERHGLDEPLFWPVEGKTAEPFEDDGNLHVEKQGTHAAFGIGQDISGAEYNRLARLVMTDLGMAKKINDRVLVEEEDDEDDERCPCCGRGQYD